MVSGAICGSAGNMLRVSGNRPHGARDQDGMRHIGESHPMAKLKRLHVDWILELHEDHKISMGRLAKMFGVSKTQIFNIVTYRNWSGW